MMETYPGYYKNRFRNFLSGVGLLRLLKAVKRSVSPRRSEYTSFSNLESLIDPRTIANTEPYLRWAQQECEREAAHDNAVEGFYRELIETFSGKYKETLAGLRILIHIPSIEASPGGYSLFRNMAQGFEFLGVQTRELHWHEDIGEVLESFRPTLFMTTDDVEFIGRLNWKKIRKYRSHHKMAIALNASIEEYGNSPLVPRLEWAKKNQIDFYFSFRTEEYLKEREAYQPFYDFGFPVFTIEMGANPFLYRMYTGGVRDLDYIFLGSNNFSQYTQYFGPILREYSGFIGGKGWSRFGWVDGKLHRYLYSRAKLGINVHGEGHREWSCELNERVYILAMTGVPQVIDHPKLLLERFPADSMFIADSPESFFTVFKEALANPEEAQRRARKAQEVVFRNHTTFHRIDTFLTNIKPFI